jgi:hypothetical protein
MVPKRAMTLSRHLPVLNIDQIAASVGNRLFEQIGNVIPSFNVGQIHAIQLWIR